MLLKQVDKSHYEFRRYMNKGRWSSVWHQLDEVIGLRPKNVLEVGPGGGVFKVMADLAGLHVETMDIDPDLKPDHLGSVFAIPFDSGAFDLVCAFQMLEHLPYEDSLKAFSEMVRVANENIVISLPDAKVLWPWSVRLPKLGGFQGSLSLPFRKMKNHVFDGEHYWEINKYGYPLSRVLGDYGRFAHLLKTYRVHENPYHRLFVYAKP